MRELAWDSIEERLEDADENTDENRLLVCVGNPGCPIVCVGLLNVCVGWVKPGCVCVGKGWPGCVSVGNGMPGTSVVVVGNPGLPPPPTGTVCVTVTVQWPF